VEIDQGKTILVQFLNVSEPNEEGMRQVFFKLNGQSRFVEVLDRTIEVSIAQNRKVEDAKDIGSPMQGKLVKVLVKPGDKVRKNDALFVIEAMKMESTVLASKEGTVRIIELSDNTMVKQDDLILSID
jgi:pyruvate carboxylase